MCAAVLLSSSRDKLNGILLLCLFLLMLLRIGRLLVHETSIYIREVIITRERNVLRERSYVNRDPRVRTVLVLIVLRIRRAAVQRLRCQRFSLHRFQGLFNNRLPHRDLRILANASCTVTDSVIARFLLHVLRRRLVHATSAPIVSRYGILILC